MALVSQDYPWNGAKKSDQTHDTRFEDMQREACRDRSNASGFTSAFVVPSKLSTCFVPPLSFFFFFFFFLPLGGSARGTFETARAFMILKT